MVEEQKKSPELKPPGKKKNIFGGGSSKKSESNHHHKVIADKVTLNIMRNTDIGDDVHGRESTLSSSLRMSTGLSTAVERGTEKLRALTKEDTEG